MNILSCVVLGLAILLPSSTQAQEERHRDPKFLFVTTATSTTKTTTTSLLSDTLTCYMFVSTKYTACKGRKKRSLYISDEPNNAKDAEQIMVSRASKALKTLPADDEALPALESGVVNKDKIGANREAKFAWYYMTTTMTTTATQTSTSTTYTTTMSVSLLTCTPSKYLGCGGK